MSGTVIRKMSVGNEASARGPSRGARNSPVAYRLACAVLVALGGLLPWSAGAATTDPVALAPGHPTTHTVVPGDTLWGISGRFLRDPWRWPEVWKANTQIRNPHLIYPGDQITLSYSGGKPVLRLRRGRGGTLKLSPTVRSSPLDAAIPTIPIDAIAPFLARPRLLSDEQLDTAPYVLSTGRESLVGEPQSKIYSSSILPGINGYSIVRRGRPYTVEEPDGNAKVLGIEAEHIADTVVLEHGNPATLEITKANKEVLIGDLLLPLTQTLIPSRFSPAVPESDVSGRIIDVVDGVTQIGQYMMVVLDVGTRHGLEQGNVLEVLQVGDTVVDPRAARPDRARIENIHAKELELEPARQGGIEGFAWAMDDVVTLISHAVTLELDAIRPGPEDFELVKLPDERAGFVMVVEAYEDMSYALVMSATKAMHKFDRVRTP